MSSQKLRAIYKQLNDKIDDAKEAALFEIKEIKADLNELQRYLSGRKKETDIQPDDIMRSAYEITHNLREIQKRRDILAELEDVAAESEALEYLESRGAKLLTRPVGWYFQTAKERFLLHAEDAVKAAVELRKLLAAGKRLKKPGKKKIAKPKPAVKQEQPKVVEAEKSAKPTKEKSPAQKAKASTKEAVKEAQAQPKKVAKLKQAAKSEKPAKDPAKKKGTVKSVKKSVKAEKAAKASKPAKTEKAKKDSKAAEKAQPAKKAKAEKPSKPKKAAPDKKKTKS